MFICASHPSLDLSNFNRLYAYPNTPVLDNTHTIILDSGAFALSKSGQRMDDNYIRLLAKHYQRFGQQNNVHCIAPDVFKNSYQSIKQYQDFKNKHPKISIAPVLQFNSSNIDLYQINQQIKRYAQHQNNTKMVCISNNKFDPVTQKAELSYIVKKIKSAFGAKIWVHVLGAGYSHIDVKNWLKTGINSMDSISYYTDAQSKIGWIRDSQKTEPMDKRFEQLALHNATIANLK